MIPSGEVFSLIPSGSIGSGEETLQNASVWAYDETSLAYDSSVTYYDNYMTTTQPIPQGDVIP